jgi:excisionase family DNA binding protein
MSNELITTAEAAVVLGTSVATVTRLAADGALATAVKAPGQRGARMFRRADVERLAAKRAKEAAA